MSFIVFSLIFDIHHLAPDTFLIVFLITSLIISLLKCFHSVLTPEHSFSDFHTDTSLDWEDGLRIEKGQLRGGSVAVCGAGGLSDGASTLVSWNRCKPASSLMSVFSSHKYDMCTLCHAQHLPWHMVCAQLTEGINDPGFEAKTLCTTT